MNKMARRPFDNISNISPSKSSKTLKSKLNAPPQFQHNKYQPPYFKDDPIREEIENRAKKESQKNEGFFNRRTNTHLQKAATIVTELLRKHEQNKEKLNKMKQQAEEKLKAECSFQPQRKKIQKYHVGGNILRRNQNWLLERKRKELQRKENKVAEDMSECTFQPVLLAKKASSIYLRNRSFSSHSFMKKKDPDVSVDLKLSPAVLKKGDITRSVFQSGKKKITDKIYNMF